MHRARNARTYVLGFGLGLESSEGLSHFKRENDPVDSVRRGSSTDAASHNDRTFGIRFSEGSLGLSISYFRP